MFFLQPYFMQALTTFIKFLNILFFISMNFVENSKIFSYLEFRRVLDTERFYICNHQLFSNILLKEKQKQNFFTC